MKAFIRKPNTNCREIPGPIDMRLTAFTDRMLPLDTIRLIVDVEVCPPGSEPVTEPVGDYWVATDWVMKNIGLFDVQAEKDMMAITHEQAAGLRDALDACLVGTKYASLAVP